MGGKKGGKGGKGKGGKGKGKKAQVVIEPHRFEGVFVSKGKDDSLVTRNLVPGESVYGEKRLAAEKEEGSEEKVECRVWPSTESQATPWLPCSQWLSKPVQVAAA